MAATSAPKLRVALCQIAVGLDKSINIARASAALATAVAEKHSNFVVLPECWNCPYSTSVFADYAEFVPKVGESPDENTSENQFVKIYGCPQFLMWHRCAGPSSAMLCNKAKEYGVWLIGGSIPEKLVVDESEKPELYNTVKL